MPRKSRHGPAAAIMYLRICVLRQYPQGELENLWRFYPTPNVTEDSDTRQAVAIGCGMGSGIGRL
jgi:hypothetical protein